MKKRFWLMMTAAVLAVVGIAVSKPETVAAADSGDAGDRQIMLSLGETADTVYISWKGGREGPNLLRFSGNKETLGISGEIRADRKKVLKGSYYRYTVKLDGLGTGRRYYYEIGGEYGYDRIRSFRVPENAEDSTFLYLGDVQFTESIDEYGEWSEMTSEICRSHPDIQFAVLGGDMVNSPGETEQWNGFLRNCGVFSKLPLMTVSGNHEGVSSNKTYMKLFESPDNGPENCGPCGEFYYFDQGSCRFIMTDSSFLTEERQAEIGYQRWKTYEEQIEEWIEKTAKNSGKPWNIAVIHHPPYGMHDRDTVSPQLRELWVPVLEKAGVDLVLCGHQHVYMRTSAMNGVTYVMGNSGSRKSEFFNGSNAPEYCASVYADSANYQVIHAGKDRLKITSYNKKGLIIDEAVICKGLLFHIFEFFCSHQVVV